MGTALRVAQAMHVSLDQLVAASPPERLARLCPVSRDGQCLLDAVDAESRLKLKTRGKVGGRRQLKLLRRFAEVVRTANPSVLMALGTLLDVILENQQVPERSDAKS